MCFSIVPNPVKLAWTSCAYVVQRKIKHIEITENLRSHKKITIVPYCAYVVQKK